MAEVDEISLRPVSLRPGGGGSNPFSGFGKGAGAQLRNKQAPEKPALSLVTERVHTGERIKYTRAFLLEFMERYTKAPPELQNLPLEVVITEEADRDAQRQALLRVAEDTDDWRVRAPQSYEQGPQPVQREPQQRSAPASDEALKIQKAADLGREAYRPGAVADNSERSIRQVKGILNKLTPEKFDRLLNQLLEVVTTAQILQTTITMTFENAVAQPTFVAMYAELCLRLSQELPSFAPAEGEDKPMTFKRVLLNTCQDEFEGASSAREAMNNISDPDERAVEEKKVKSRTLGTCRLIAELYNKEVVQEKIMIMCVRELLGAANPKQIPPEDNLEAACEMITIAGKPLANSTNKGAQDTLKGFLARLSRLAEAKELPSRMRFIIRDVLELERNKWKRRRETFTAKKLDEVHAEAEAELGMVPKTVANLAPLPAQQRTAQEEMVLLPPLRGDDGWETVGRKGPKSFSGNSALVGEYKPPPPRQTAPPPAAAPAAAPVSAADAPAPAKPAKPLTEDQVTNKTRGLLAEYASSLDEKEATACVKELGLINMGKMLKAALQNILDTPSERDAGVITKLIAKLAAGGGLFGKDEVQAALLTFTETLEDLSLDVPKAPKLLGQFAAELSHAGALELSSMPDLLAKVESAEPKRNFSVALLKEVKELGGEEALSAAAEVDWVALLEADPDFDPGLPPSADFLKKQGLAAVMKA